MSKREELLNFLKAACTGQDNAKDGVSLERALHISRSELQRNVNRLRRDGFPIGSCRQGYYYAVTAGEAYATIRQLQQMERGLQSAIRGLEDTLKEFTRGDGRQFKQPGIGGM